jgi:hypothetical protein
MYRRTSDPLALWLAKQRQAELIHEAEQYRLARDAKQYRLATAQPVEPVADRAIRLISTIRGGLGRWFAGVQRALPRYEAPCDEPCPDCA